MTSKAFAWSWAITRALIHSLLIFMVVVAAFLLGTLVGAHEAGICPP